MVDMRSKQLYSIDFIKFIMAICVVAIHTHPLETVTNNVVINNLYNEFVNLAVPFFFMTNGYLLFQKVNTNDMNETFSALKNFGVKMLKLYMIWNIVYLPLSVYPYIKFKETILKSILVYVRDFLLVGFTLLFMATLVFAVSSLCNNNFIFFST